MAVAAIRASRKTVSARPSLRPSLNASTYLEIVQRAKQTAAVLKINAGNIDELTRMECEELYDVLDRNHNGSLEMAEFAALLQGALDLPYTDEEVDIMRRAMDKDLNDMILPDEFCTALTSGEMRMHLRFMKEAANLEEMFDDEQRKQLSEVSREVLVDNVSQYVSRDDAFCTLPFSLLYILLFTALVIFRLDISPRFQVEKDIEEWVAGYGEDLLGPYLKEYVASTDGMWDWLLSSGSAAVFGNCAKEVDGNYMCRLADQHLLVGDAELVSTRQDGTQVSHLLLHHPQAVASMKTDPGNVLGAVRSALGALRREGFAADAHTDELFVSFVTYSDKVNMFVTNNFGVQITKHGMAVHLVKSRAAMAQAYPHAGAIALDVIFLALTMWPLFQELKQIVHTARHKGVVAGCRSYWSFWNVVDWFNVLQSLSIVATWAFTGAAMQADPLSGALAEDDGKLVLMRNVMLYGEDEVTAVRQSVETVVTMFVALQIIMAVNVLTIMLKFFKGFEANKRLQLVTNTLVDAATDIFHFSVVFFAIFLTFASIGHLLFGRDISEFSTIGSSIDTAHIMLIGEYGWYVDLMNGPSILPSGMPSIFATIWFWSYTVFVVLIVLNMLLAIILNYYAEHFDEVSNGTEHPPLWGQAMSYVRRMRETKGHITMFQLLHQLTDDKNPAHPEPVVDKISLLDHFKTMDDAQATWLMDWLLAEVHAKNAITKESEEMQRLVALEVMFQQLSKELEALTRLSTHSSTNLESLEETLTVLQASNSAWCKKQDNLDESLCKEAVGDILRTAGTCGVDVVDLLRSGAGVEV
eukprot:TRINITY_DN7992_c0_g2_i1.p1 TRINITY_DN7992_c0_g2~~TRINITY_DN7992_c0_g2_i1.p1  ORF type:complete len:844 (+),score=196.04 TRINITY_DN7992_c0_g2_i1:104-2533(+)